MREIKVRAWDKSKKKWETGIGMSMNGELITNHNEDYELVQYTGLKDRNGIEIYESDIVRFTPSTIIDDTRMPRNCKVVFEGYSFVMRESEWHKNTLCDEFGPMLEVIGNVYQHPELI